MFLLFVSGWWKGNNIFVSNGKVYVSKVTTARKSESLDHDIYLLWFAIWLVLGIFASVKFPSVDVISTELLGVCVCLCVFARVYRNNFKIHKLLIFHIIVMRGELILLRIVLYSIVLSLFFFAFIFIFYLF